MRTLAIGDVHGCFTAMTTLLACARVDPSDKVIWLGDYVDRGPDSARVVEFLTAQLSIANTVCLRGNHEVMMSQARNELPGLRAWESYGGDSTKDSYRKLFGGDGLDSVPQSHWEFIASLAPYHQTETHIFVHASLDAEIEMADQFDETLYWGDFSSIGPHRSGKPVICGHSSQKSGMPKSLGHAICIDTWVYGDGWLTCLDVNSGRYWQANQAGESRSDWLDSP